MVIKFEESYKNYNISDEALSGKLDQVFFKKLRLDGIDSIYIIDRKRLLGNVDLEFLKFAPWLKELHFNVLDFRIEQLKYVKNNLESINIGTESKKNIEFLIDFPNIINIGGNIQNYRVVNNFKKLKFLGIGQSGLDIIDFTNLNNLVFLSIYKCKNHGISNINELKKLKALSINFDNNIKSLDFISQMEYLQAITLLYTSNITAFPDVSKNKSLKRIYLYTVNNLRDISSLRFNKSLEEVVIINSNLKAEIVKPLLECPNLKRVYWDLGSVSETKKAEDWFAPLIDKSVMDEPYYVK